MTRSLHERLQALRQSADRAAPSVPAGVGVPSAPAPGYTDVAPAQPPMPTGFRYEEGPLGRYCVRQLRFDLLSMHGEHRFSDVLDCDLTALWKVTRAHPAPPEVHAERLRFYDTETSGLGTGAGTFPFLHAVGRIEEDEFVVTQYFLNDHAEEPALLAALVEQHFSSGRELVVTFNGKSFDWPLLRNRLVMHSRGFAMQAYAAAEARPKLDVADVQQVDLLYPARRLWRTKLQSVSLRNVEAHVLGLRRVDDVPGKEAPARYFAWRDDQPDAGLQPVFDHNAADVCTLVGLAARLAEILTGRRAVDSAGEFVALGRWHDEWQEHELAIRCYTAATHCLDATWQTYWSRGQLCKRTGRWDEAVDVWGLMADKFAWSIPPLVELAKHAEHRLRDLEAAERWTRLALARAVERGARLRHPVAVPPVPGEPPGSGVLETLQHRLRRVQRKRGIAR